MLALPLTFVLQLAYAPCADLSGRYTISGEDGSVDVRIVQTRCERVAVSWESSMTPRRPVTHSITLDGVLRESISWFGSDRMHVAGTINDAVLAFRFVYPGRVPNRTTDVMRRLELLADGSLCVTDDNTGPRQPPAIARRVGIGAPTRREIALRTAGDACSVR